MTLITPPKRLCKIDNIGQYCWFLDSVYVICKPEVFNGWIAIVINMDNYKADNITVRTSDGEFIYDFNGYNKNFEVEYVGNINSGFNGF